MDDPASNTDWDWMTPHEAPLEGASRCEWHPNVPRGGWARAEGSRAAPGTWSTKSMGSSTRSLSPARLWLPRSGPPARPWPSQASTPARPGPDSFKRVCCFWGLILLLSCSGRISCFFAGCPRKVWKQALYRGEHDLGLPHRGVMMEVHCIRTIRLRLRGGGHR